MVEQADEGELLLVKRVLIGFQRIKEPKEDPFHTKQEKTIIPTPLPPFQLPQKGPPKEPSQIEPFSHF